VDFVRYFKAVNYIILDLLHSYQINKLTVSLLQILFILLSPNLVVLVNLFFSPILSRGRTQYVYLVCM